ncbi:hypothetical protein A3A71_00670 [Candidatus Berkelbacteria bacterium RIFCSPLOWO2_01_FULL_50_28]|uniref:Glycosyltransferase subfamily 4-like N-terminal domain-containing protein n=1 Tax=Candidatus Berkelbacteria bacterium RIFCSPLOWO2_01_FULL_50_28 TaxID=1797471 RepID=A0A1F5EB02_9BACT|nr:MAG: hypothetical protein A2807_01045 [Candidatus Berkelbacteria bacterium RIFCSPHIGHO2_01_FULL_50_36]OGD62904.1 MAG: hypothetical protein A3F39_04060 [Candidatus Berkelbacteria bacterium RIFCSPHIGHO2_12_FULL_50_11]OGD64555.1 MAG: hypothetical protein A3A71_00670 [Candidatus Berkelbacteria bacterium RIFCSPLOWO2_01_FULL_50_28]
MKILVVVPYFDEPHRWMISGQKTAFELARHHQVVVLTTGVKAAVERPVPNLTIHRIKDWFIPDPVNFSIIPGLYGAVRRLVRTESPDAFLINKHMFWSSLSIWPLKRMGKKVVVQTDTFPGVNWFPRSKLVGLVMIIYARLVGNRIMKAADKVVLLHEGLVEDAKRLGLNYTVIHNGLELDKFDAVAAPSDLKKKPGDIWVGYVGRLESVKGWYDLATVAMKMVGKRPNLHFFFAGPKEKAEEALKAFQHPQIHFLGSRKDVAGLDKMFDIFVMPSLSEGLSNAIMEAMAAGCACLVSNVGGNKILLDKNEGLFFEPGNLGDLETKLLGLINDPVKIKELGRLARAKIAEEFDLSVNVEKLAEALKSTSATR